MAVGRGRPGFKNPCKGKYGGGKQNTSTACQKERNRRRQTRGKTVLKPSSLNSTTAN